MTQQCVTGEMSIPFNAEPGNTMTEVLWATMMKNVLGTGVINSTSTTGWQYVPGYGYQYLTSGLNSLAVAPGTGLAVTVDTGEAWVYGHYYQNSIVQTLTFDANTNAAGTRADLIVLDCKWVLGLYLFP